MRDKKSIQGRQTGQEFSLQAQEMTSFNDQFMQKISRVEKSSLKGGNLVFQGQTKSTNMIDSGKVSTRREGPVIKKKT